MMFVAGAALFLPINSSQISDYARICEAVISHIRVSRYLLPFLISLHMLSMLQLFCCGCFSSCRFYATTAR